MTSFAQLDEHDDRPVGDSIVHLSGVTWEDYERLLEIRGDHSAPRMTYLKGVLEIMSPSGDHESLKSRIGHLVEVYCLFAGLEFEAFGSWTLKEKREERGVEPDECYVFGLEDRKRPHLAIEVVWTSGGIGKLEVYRKLDVQEVWYWERGKLSAYALRGDQYEPVPCSAVLPGIALDQLVTFLDRPRASQAIRDYRAALEADQ